jgi:hypothetical protein
MKAKVQVKIKKDRGTYKWVYTLTKEDGTQNDVGEIVGGDIYYAFIHGEADTFDSFDKAKDYIFNKINTEYLAD